MIFVIPMAGASSRFPALDTRSQSISWRQERTLFEHSVRRIREIFHVGEVLVHSAKGASLQSIYREKVARKSDFITMRLLN